MTCNGFDGLYLLLFLPLHILLLGSGLPNMVNLMESSVLLNAVDGEKEKGLGIVAQVNKMVDLDCTEYR